MGHVTLTTPITALFVISRLILDVTYLKALASPIPKICLAGHPKNKNGSRDSDLAHYGVGVVCHPKG